jgi:hypothetical protein
VKVLKYGALTNILQIQSDASGLISSVTISHNILNQPSAAELQSDVPLDLIDDLVPYSR